MMDSMLLCDDHPQAVLICDYRAGDMICPDCGRVIGDRLIDVGAEWRLFADNAEHNESVMRVGAAHDLTMGPEDLSTQIGVANKEQSALKSTQRRANGRTSADVAQRKALSEIREMAQRIKCDDAIVKLAQRHYVTACRDEFNRGRQVKALVACCLYVACRQENAPRSFKEICSLNGATLKMTSRCYLDMSKKYGLKTEQSAVEYLPRFCTRLNLDVACRKRAEKLIDELQQNVAFSSCSPISLAATVIYLAAEADKPSVSYEAIKEASGASASVIRRLVKLARSKS